MNKRLLDICQQLPDVDVSEFQKFTSKWINYVKSNTTGDNIPESDWNQLFTRSNPVAGIDRGEMQDRIKQRNGEREKLMKGVLLSLTGIRLFFQF